VAPGSEVGGSAHIAAEADDHLSVDPEHGLLRSGDGSLEVARESKKRRARLAGQWDLGHHGQVIATGRYESSLESLGRTERRDGDIGVLAAEMVSQGKQR